MAIAPTIVEPKNWSQTAPARLHQARITAPKRERSSQMSFATIMWVILAFALMWLVPNANDLKYTPHLQIRVNDALDGLCVINYPLLEQQR